MIAINELVHKVVLPQLPEYYTIFARKIFFLPSLGGNVPSLPPTSYACGWHGYVPGSRCRFAYGPADATATHYLLLQ